VRSFWPVPAFQWASAVATLLFVLVVAGDLLGVLGSGGSIFSRTLGGELAPAAAPAPTASGLEFAVGTESIGAEMSVAAEEDLAQGAAEIPATEDEISKGSVTPEPSPLGAEALDAGSLTPEPLEESLTLTTAVPQPEEAVARDAIDSGSSPSGDMQVRALEGVLAALALLTALAAIILRRRAI
jgi:hypothetical protein